MGLFPEIQGSPIFILFADSSIAKQLIDKIYEKRKAAALDLEKLDSPSSKAPSELTIDHRQIRECHQQGEDRKIAQIIDQLVDMFSNTSNPLHVRNGGLIGLAGTAIALSVEVAPYMEKFVYPLLDCFVDPENRIRYFSAECLYNIAKVSKGEVLVYFNEIFDALSKVKLVCRCRTCRSHPSTARCGLRIICEEWGRVVGPAAEGYRRRICFRLHSDVSGEGDTSR